MSAVPLAASWAPTPSPSPPLELSEAEFANLMATHLPPSSVPSSSAKGKKPLVILSPEELETLAKQDKVSFDETDDAELGEVEVTPWWEDVANAVLWTIPFGFLFCGMDYAVHAQFGVDLKAHTELSRLLNAVPPLLVLNILSVRLPALPVQIALLALCISTGSSLVHLTGTQSYLLVMKQAPSLGMLWTWSVVKLDLLWAVLGLLGVMGVVWMRGDLGTVYGR